LHEWRASLKPSHTRQRLDGAQVATLCIIKLLIPECRDGWRDAFALVVTGRRMLILHVIEPKPGERDLFNGQPRERGSLLKTEIDFEQATATLTDSAPGRSSGHPAAIIASCSR
jgi:hypothetical protein